MDDGVISRVSAFEIVLAVVGVIAAVLGFQLINVVYSKEGIVSWTMIIAIFNWLTLLILFILLSLAVDVSKKQLAKMEILVYLLNDKKRKK